jgi:uncharacterized membrane protein YphA (DoxX/SURF4 family)
MSEPTDKPSTLHPHFLLGVRLVITLIWLYEGLWQKIIVQDTHELSIVQQFAATPESARLLMAGIGGAETLLALGVLSGLLARPLACFQVFILVTMNLTGIFFGRGTIAAPVSLIIHNLPLLLCMAMVGIYGPGAFVLNLNLILRRRPC